MVRDRLNSGRELLSPAGILCVTIDDYQQKELHFVTEEVFGKDNLVATVAVRINPSGRPVPSGFGQSHEYAIFARKSEKATTGRLPRTEEQNARYRHEDGNGKFMWELFRKRGSSSERSDRPSLFYPIFACVKNGKVRIPKMNYDEAKREWELLETPNSNERIALPIDSAGTERRWRGTPDAIRDCPGNYKAKFDEDEIVIYYKFRPSSDDVLPLTNWIDSKYSATEHGTGVLKHYFRQYSPFSYPKSLFAVEDCLRVCGMNSRDSIVADYFAGSGTTAHAVVDMNRKDNGDRKYVLVEEGRYFDTVTKPRVCKVAYSKEWSEGFPTSREGIGHTIKYLRLESYEDTLNNLTLDDQSPDLLGQPQELQDEYLLRYCLDTETNSSLLDCEQFKDPFNYQLKIYDRESGEAKPTNVDLPETFNYLLGLQVRTMQMKEETLVIEGENPAAETVLVIWRNVEAMDNEKLETFVSKTLRVNTADTEYAAIYINGDTTLNDPHKKILLTEQVFHDLMFDVEDV